MVFTWDYEFELEFPERDLTGDFAPERSVWGRVTGSHSSEAKEHSVRHFNSYLFKKQKVLQFSGLNH